MDLARLHLILEKHLPPAAIPYCLGLWQSHPFDFHLRKRRISKVGDFTCKPGNRPRITINHDSHPYLFLLTYIHEVAHLHVHRQHGWKLEAHGKTWKESFQSLMEPVLKEEVFPHDLLQILQKHMHDPMASSFSDTNLTKALRKYDDRQRNTTLLSELPEGSIFGLHGRWFSKGPMKRTRVLCRELKTRRNYLVSADAPIESGQLSLL